MLEAVNSVLSNAPLLKPSQANSAPKSVQVQRADYVKVDTANYASRDVRLDVGSPKPILQIRDTSTGKSLKQFPTEGQIRAYAQAQAVSAGQVAIDSGKIEPSAAELDAQIASTPDIQKPEAVEASVEVSVPVPGPVGGNVSESA